MLARAINRPRHLIFAGPMRGRSDRPRQISRPGVIFFHTIAKTIHPIQLVDILVNTKTIIKQEKFPIIPPSSYCNKFITDLQERLPFLSANVLFLTREVYYLFFVLLPSI